MPRPCNRPLGKSQTLRFAKSAIGAPQILMDNNKYFPDFIPIKEALELQADFSSEIVLEDKFPAEPKTVCGIAIYSRGANIIVGLSLYDVATRSIKQKKVFCQRVATTPVPGCEGFREGKAIADAINAFDKADIYLINGSGINHPRRLGVASHVGVALDVPTIGASTQLACGVVTSENGQRYIASNGEKSGKVVRKTPVSAQIFVSPGHRISVDSAAEIVESLLIQEIPEPIRAAQSEVVSEMKKRIAQI